MEFDARANRDNDVIRVADNNGKDYNITTLKRRTRATSGITLRTDTDYAGLHVLTKTDAKSLIAGIEKAIELGWLKD